jgi:hypothetical protein
VGQLRSGTAIVGVQNGHVLAISANVTVGSSAVNVNMIANANAMSNAGNVTNPTNKTNN